MRQVSGLLAELDYAAFIEVTYRCNLTCHMCWYHGDNGIITKKDFRHELTLNDIDRLLYSISQNTKISKVTLAGAEPLVRKDICEIIAIIKSYGFKAILLTNGTLFNEPLIKKLIESGVDQIRISLDGDRHYHNMIRNNRTAYEKTLEGLALLKRNRVNLSPDILFNYVITKINLSDILHVIDMASEFLCKVNIQHLMWMDGLEISEHVELIKDKLGLVDNTAQGFENNYNSIEPLLLFDVLKKAKRYANESGVELTIGQFDDLDSIKKWYEPTNSFQTICTFVNHSLRIGAEGNVKPCQFINYSFGSIHKTDLHEIWLGEKKRNFEEFFCNNQGLPICKRCCKNKFSS